MEERGGEYQGNVKEAIACKKRFSNNPTFTTFNFQVGGDCKILATTENRSSLNFVHGLGENTSEKYFQTKRQNHFFLLFHNLTHSIKKKKNFKKKKYNFKKRNRE